MEKLILQGDYERKKGIRYEIDTNSAPLGEGGSGTVYRGVMIKANGIERDVAVKFLYSDLPPEQLARARKEASIQIRNDNLLEMLGFIELTDDFGEKRYHVVSELLSGVMLHELLNGKTENADGTPVSYAKKLYELYLSDKTLFAITILRSILSGVMALHDNGYIHRDIDPSNIMITTSGHIKLIDFGLAKSIAPDRTAVPLSINGRFLGKPEYAAPELVLGDITSQNKTTDIYALGVLLYQLSTGHLPFEGTMLEVFKAQREKKPPLSEVKNKKLREIIGKAMEKKQAKRFQSAQEFRVALDKVDTTNNKKPKKLKEGEGKGGNEGNKLKWLFAILVALLAICAAYYFLSSDDSKPGTMTEIEVRDTTLVRVATSSDTTKLDSHMIVTTRNDSVFVVSTKKSTGNFAASDTFVSSSTTTDTIKIAPPKTFTSPNTPSNGTLRLDYGTWNGYVLNNKPHGLGKMIYTKAHPIGNGETAQPGDVIVGNNQNGRWVDIPTWHKSSGETKKIYNL